jgi:transcriptional regulator with PAS, ATPase and Fis domain
MADGAEIGTDLFREHLILPGGTDPAELFVTGTKTLKEKTEEYEKEIIESTLAISKNMKEAAMRLGIDISTLVRKKQKYSL